MPLLLGIALCALHGTTFLGLKTGGEVRLRSRVLADRLVWRSLVLVAGYAVWTVTISSGGRWRILAVVVAGVAALVAVLLVGAGRDGRAFTATAVTIGGVIAALFASLYPNVMVSSTTTANNVTVTGAASGDYAQKVMTVVAVVIFPAVLVYQGWSYWVFRARINAPTAVVDASSSSADAVPS